MNLLGTAKMDDIPTWEKWQFCPDAECDYCGELIKEEDVLDKKVVTGCPYCNYSFVE